MQLLGVHFPAVVSSSNVTFAAASVHCRHKPINEKNTIVLERRKKKKASRREKLPYGNHRHGGAWRSLCAVKQVLWGCLLRMYSSSLGTTNTGTCPLCPAHATLFHRPVPFQGPYSPWITLEIFEKRAPILHFYLGGGV